MMAPIRISPTVKLISIACVVGFIVQQSIDLFLGGALLSQFGLVPKKFIVDHSFWQIFTYPFLHGDVLHLALNVVMLIFIGSDLEFLWGRRKFTFFFFTCSTVAGIFYLLLQAWVYGGAGLHTPMVGASGGVYGLLIAYGVVFGERVMLFMLLFPMKAKYFIWLLAAIEFFSSIFSSRSSLSSAAHIGGMIAGLAFVVLDRRYRFSTQIPRGINKLIQTRTRRSTRKSSKRSHLKLVIDNEDEDSSSGGPKTWH